MQNPSQTSTSFSLYGWYRGWIQGKTRHAAAWTFALTLGYFSRGITSSHFIIYGALISFLGASLRFWTSGYLKKDSQLAIRGPYSWVRNPLYLGTYFMAVGAVFAVQNLVLFAFVSVAFAVVYHYIILDEENKLKRLFGKPYFEYCDLVSRFFPLGSLIKRLSSANWHQRLNMVSDLSKSPNFSWEIAWKNKAYEAYAAFAGLAIWIFGASMIWKTILN